MSKLYVAVRLFDLELAIFNIFHMQLYISFSLNYENAFQLYSIILKL